jgi:hypothetical protein
VSGDIKFVEESLKRYDDPLFLTALNEDFDVKFRSILQSANDGKITPLHAKDELRRILREDYISKLRNVSQFSVDEEQTFERWVGELDDKAPPWITKYLHDHPDIAKRTNIRLAAHRDHLPPKEILKTYGFRMMVDNSVILERFLQLPPGALTRGEENVMTVTILPDELFEEAPRLLCAKPVQLQTTAKVSRSVEMMSIREKDGWPELITSALLKGLHDHDRHPYVSLFHDRQLHLSLLNSFTPELREDLVRLAKVVESLPAVAKTHLDDHIAEEILEGVFLAPYIKDGKIVFDLSSPYRRAILFILKAGKIDGKFSEKLAQHLQSALKKTSFLVLKKR